MGTHDLIDALLYTELIGRAIPLFAAGCLCVIAIGAGIIGCIQSECKRIQKRIQRRLQNKKSSKNENRKER